VIAVLVLVPICSIVAASTGYIRWEQSRPGLLSLGRMIGENSVAYAAAAGTENSLDKDMSSMELEVDKRSVSPVTLDKRDQAFVLLVFIGSIIAAVASVISMMIKIKRLKPEGGIDLLKENK